MLCCRNSLLDNVFAGYLHLAESKLKALSVAVRLKQPDKRFEAIKNYGNELEVNVTKEINMFIVPCFRSRIV
jgi:hypothetical protein